MYAVPMRVDTRYSASVIYIEKGVVDESLND